MKFFETILASMLAFSVALAAPVPDVIPPTPQCGGKYWQGPTTCTRDHYVCFKFNDSAFSTFFVTLSWDD
ncbi:hypothetical protein H1R20_g121, partial [Candolleomyces eurysporus]